MRSGPGENLYVLLDRACSSSSIVTLFVSLRGYFWFKRIKKCNQPVLFIFIARVYVGVGAGFFELLSLKVCLFYVCLLFGTFFQKSVHVGSSCLIYSFNLFPAINFRLAFRSSELGNPMAFFIFLLADWCFWLET